jgi:hypothetical protein
VGEKTSAWGGACLRVVGLTLAGEIIVASVSK